MKDTACTQNVARAFGDKVTLSPKRLSPIHIERLAAWFWSMLTSPSESGAPPKKSKHINPKNRDPQMAQANQDSTLEMHKTYDLQAIPAFEDQESEVDHPIVIRGSLQRSACMPESRSCHDFPLIVSKLKLLHAQATHYVRSFKAFFYFSKMIVPRAIDP